MRVCLPAVGALLLAPACASATGRAASGDAPIPAGEARATLRVILELEPTGDCDERFDLTLYQDRSVERIAWDDGRGCTARRVEITYVPGRTAKDALMQRIRGASRKVNDG